MCDKYLFIFILCADISFAERDTMPAFLIDNGDVLIHVQTEENPFVRTGHAQFADIVHDAMRRSETVIVFLENTFCLEDVTTKDNKGTPYHQLHEWLMKKKAKFMPAVEHPFLIIKRILEPLNTNVFHIGLSPTKHKLYESVFKYVYVYFKDLMNETRVDSLRRHDLIIREVYNNIQKISKGPVLAFYTGTINPIVKEELEMHLKPIVNHAADGILVISDSALFRLFGVKMSVLQKSTAARTTFFNQPPVVSQQSRAAGDRVVTRLSYTDFDLKFSFKYKDADWLLEHVALMEDDDEVGRTVLMVGAEWGRSYFCGDPLTIVNTRDRSTVYISRYQIEPLEGFLRSDGNATIQTQFSESVSCSLYFTCHLLECFVVVFICLFILFSGVITTMNCHSYDRFDDPQGKTINIAATERL